MCFSHGVRHRRARCSRRRRPPSASGRCGGHEPRRRASRACRRLGVRTGTTPAATGRERFVGCSRSASTSSGVVPEVVPLLPGRRRRRRGSSGRAASSSSSTPAAPGAANTSTFLSHCGAGRCARGRAPSATPWDEHRRPSGPERGPALGDDVGVVDLDARGPPCRARRTPWPGDGRGGWPAGRRAARRRTGSMRRPSVGLATSAPGLAQLGGEVAEAVALLGPDEPDAADRRRRRRRRGDGGQRRHEVGDVGHVDVDADAAARRRRARRSCPLVGRSTVQPIARRAARRTRRRPGPSGGAARHRAPGPPATAAIASG